MTRTADWALADLRVRDKTKPYAMDYQQGGG